MATSGPSGAAVSTVDQGPAPRTLTPIGIHLRAESPDSRNETCSVTGSPAGRGDKPAAARVQTLACDRRAGDRIGHRAVSCRTSHRSRAVA
jgi:hypothetical protein